MVPRSFNLDFGGSGKSGTLNEKDPKFAKWDGVFRVLGGFDVKNPWVFYVKYQILGSF
jgi:hypothetical protein